MADQYAPQKSKLKERRNKTPNSSFRVLVLAVVVPCLLLDRTASPPHVCVTLSGRPVSLMASLTCALAGLYCVHCCWNSFAISTPLCSTCIYPTLLYTDKVTHKKDSCCCY